MVYQLYVNKTITFLKGICGLIFLCDFLDTIIKQTSEAHPRIVTDNQRANYFLDCCFLTEQHQLMLYFPPSRSSWNLLFTLVYNLFSFED